MDIVETITSITPFDWLRHRLRRGHVRPRLRPGRRPAAARDRRDRVLVPARRQPARRARRRSWPATGPSSRASTRTCSRSLFLFIVFMVISTIVIQASYKPAPLFAQVPDRRRDPRRRAGHRPGAPDHRRRHRDPRLVLPAAGRRSATNQVQLFKDIYGAVNESQVVGIFRDTLIPLFVARLRAAPPVRHPGALPADLTALGRPLARALLAATDPRGRARPARLPARRRRSRARPDRRPDRRGRGVHRRGRPSLARPVRADGAERRRCTASPAAPTCTLSTACTPV